MCECTVVYNIGGSRGVFFWGNLSLACIFPCPVPPCREAAPKVCWSAQPQALPASSPNRQTFFCDFRAENQTSDDICIHVCADFSETRFGDIVKTSRGKLFYPAWYPVIRGWLTQPIQELTASNHLDNKLIQRRR